MSQEPSKPITAQPPADADELIRSGESPADASARETPADGSFLGPGADTLPQGHRPAQPPEPEAGLPFDRLGHYQILERIGGGGMGDVYRGHDASLDRYVAVKVLRAELARDEDYVRRFHAEAGAVARLDHPNIVPLYFSGEDGGHHFFAMQFIEGESLSQRLRRCGKLPAEEAVAIAAHCLAGLEAAHAEGLIHRDVKPGNILMDRRRGSAVLVDFGLVRHQGAGQRLTAAGAIMGTVEYMAPEQARRQPIDGRADIYSLGVLLYQMLAGRLPFTADTPTAMIFQHAYEEPLPLREAVPDLPTPVVALVARMMAKDPAQRYQNCAEALADLGAVRQEPTAAFPAVELEEEVELPERVSRLASYGPWQRICDWAATMFRRNAPQFVQELQDTTQQVDGAVAAYERRRNRLARLVEEGRAIRAAGCLGQEAVVAREPRRARQATRGARAAG